MDAKAPVTIEKLVSGGWGLGRDDEGVFLVPGALPGEILRLGPWERRAGVRRAGIVEILKPSPDRVEPDCPWYGRCGGCDFMHLGAEAQAQAKAAWVQETFARLGGLDVALPRVRQGAVWAYRHRFQLHPGSGGWGWRSARGQEVLVPDFCRVLSPEAEAARKKGPPGPAEDAPARERPMRPYRPPQVRAQGLVHDRGVAWAGQPPVQVTLAGRPLWVDPAGFFQSNLDLLPLLAERLAEVLGQGNILWDLYGGVGTFGALLAPRFTQVILVEPHPGAAAVARRNLPPPHRVEALSAEAWARRRPGRPDAVVVDPPREGLSPEVRALLNAVRPSRLAYVSCNPDTQARDLKELCAPGRFTLQGLELFDFYPQTSHVETLAWLEARS